jgi:hypothetical protein
VNPSADPVADLRGLSPEAWTALGRESLRQHLAAQALVARHRYGPLTPDTLPAFLSDAACVRYPTRLVFELGEMALHQFAQPELDPRDPDRQGRVLYLRPNLRERPDQIARAVAYMVPVINYGDIVRDDDCLAYGAALLGLREDEYYGEICGLADGAGAEPRLGGAAGVARTG